MIPKQLSFAKFASENDTFQSHEGNTIYLGLRHQIAPSNSYQNYDFLRHYDGPPQPAPQALTSSASGTHFDRQKKEFTKRPVTSIENLRALEHRQHSEKTEIKKQEQSVGRSAHLLHRSQQTGYNLITGEIVGSGPQQSRHHTHYLADGMGTESQRRGLQIMRGSENRFFAPQFSGDHQSHRQKVLVTEGLIRSKQTKILAQGSRESVPSYGIEDQFSKSQYVSRGRSSGSRTDSGLRGLVEDSEPGKYSPRKQGPFNPSGNIQVTSPSSLALTYRHR
jgi:hypothetical protein